MGCSHPVCYSPRMARPPSLELLSSTKRRLLVGIKLRGVATIETLAHDSFLSPGAARQHLQSLASMGLVSHTDVRGGPGRPKHVFELTPAGQWLFPHRYAEFGDALLNALEEEGDGVYERILSRAAFLQLESEWKRLAGLDFAARCDEVPRILEECGYLPEVSHGPSGEVTLRLQHCPLMSIATVHPLVCEAECRWISDAFAPGTVERIERMSDGLGACAYRVTPPRAGTPE